MAIPPISWQSRVTPGQIGRTTPDGRLEGIEDIELADASIYQALGGARLVLGTGAALAKAQAPGDLALVDGLALLAFPSEASPNTPLVRAATAAANFQLALAQPTGLVTGRRAVFHLLVANTSGGAITLFLADAATGRVPLFYHADHSGARPTIAAGAAELFEVTYLPAPERGIVRKVGAATTFRRTRPTLIGTAMPAPAADATIAGQLAGDLLISYDFRNAVTNQSALRTGFTALQQVGVASEFAMRVAYRVAAANGETIPFPASNAPTRSLIQCWRGVDGASPIIGSAQAAGVGIAGDITTVAASEPGLAIIGLCGRQYSGSLNWLLPSGYASSGDNINAGGTFVRTGAHPDMIGIPPATFATPGLTQAWGSCSIILRGAAL